MREQQAHMVADDKTRAQGGCRAVSPFRRWAGRTDATTQWGILSPSPALYPLPMWTYLCVTESPISLRTICGDPCGRSAERERPGWTS